MNDQIIKESQRTQSKEKETEAQESLGDCVKSHQDQQGEAGALTTEELVGSDTDHGNGVLGCVVSAVVESHDPPLPATDSSPSLETGQSHLCRDGVSHRLVPKAGAANGDKGEFEGEVSDIELVSQDGENVLAGMDEVAGGASDFERRVSEGNKVSMRKGKQEGTYDFASLVHVVQGLTIAVEESNFRQKECMERMELVKERMEERIEQRVQPLEDKVVQLQRSIDVLCEKVHSGSNTITENVNVEAHHDSSVPAAVLCSERPDVLQSDILQAKHDGVAIEKIWDGTQHGVRAVKGLRKGKVFGDVFLKQRTRESMKQYAVVGMRGKVMDGQGPGVSKYVNHSCEPNAKLVVYRDECGRDVLRCELSRNVQPGEWITVDYGWVQEWPEEPREACLCGAVDCRGYLQREYGEGRESEQSSVDVESSSSDESESMDERVLTAAVAARVRELGYGHRSRRGSLGHGVRVRAELGSSESEGSNVGARAVSSRRMSKKQRVGASSNHPTQADEAGIRVSAATTPAPAAAVRDGGGVQTWSRTRNSVMGNMRRVNDRPWCTPMRAPPASTVRTGARMGRGDVRGAARRVSMGPAVFHDAHTHPACAVDEGDVVYPHAVSGRPLREEGFPEWKGTRAGEYTPRQWLDRFKEVASLRMYTMEENLRIARAKLHGDAVKVWHDGVVHSLIVEEGLVDAELWEGYKQAFLERYCRREDEGGVSMLREFYGLSMESSESVQQFHDRLQQAAMLIEESEGGGGEAGRAVWERRKLEVFRRGLDVGISVNLVDNPPVSLEEAVSRAMRLERVMERDQVGPQGTPMRRQGRGKGVSASVMSVNVSEGGSSGESDASNDSHSASKIVPVLEKSMERLIEQALEKMARVNVGSMGNKSGSRGSRYDRGGRGREHVECHTCHKTGHYARECPDAAPVECFKCGEVGHISTQCEKQAWQLRCTHCKQNGHVEKVCLQRKKEQGLLGSGGGRRSGGEESKKVSGQGKDPAASQRDQ